jgi:peptidyl-prolyl cis-trans isomerase C
MKKTLALVGLLTLNVALADDPVVATVNGEKILKSTLDQSYQQNLLFLSNKKVTREKVLDDLISRELGVQKAKANKLDKDPVILSKMEDILYHAQISKDLEGQFKKITVSDDDVKKYYEDNKEYRTAHILYRLRAEPTPDEVKAAYEQTMAIYAQLQKTPEDFAKMANKYSQTSAAPVGGDLGFQPPTRLAPEYFEAIKGQKAGFISKPTRSQMGYHIIKVLGVKSFEQIDKNLYKKIIYDKKRDALMDEYFKGLAQGVVIKKNI